LSRALCAGRLAACRCAVVSRAPARLPSPAVIYCRGQSPLKHLPLASHASQSPLSPWQPHQHQHHQPVISRYVLARLFIGILSPTEYTRQYFQSKLLRSISEIRLNLCKSTVYINNYYDPHIYITGELKCKSQWGRYGAFLGFNFRGTFSHLPHTKPMQNENKLYRRAGGRHNMPPPLQVDNIFVFIRQVAPIPACWLFKTSSTS